jgi:extracellular factor (EF) 3-hydroxypalmitic acid methyl ester biosynthesis protein
VTNIAQRSPDSTSPYHLRLQEAANAFVAAANADLRDEQQAHHHVAAAVHALCEALRNAEVAMLPPEVIKDALTGARAIHATSPFIQRLQSWPRGHAGDFETMEYLCEASNRAAPGTMGYFLEQQALRTATAQQHRNKIAWQSTQALETACARRHARILSVACGGCRDLRSVETLLDGMDARVVLNDVDADALRCAVEHLPRLAGGLRLVHGDVFNAVGRLAPLGPYDLILAGGLFDYQNEREVLWLLPRLFDLLAPGGRLCFTNIATGNPDRVWMAYLADWLLAERSESDILRLVEASVPAAERVLHIDRETTGLTHLVTLLRHRSAAVRCGSTPGAGTATAARTGGVAARACSSTEASADEAPASAALVGRIHAGDRGAEGELVRRYSQAVHFLLRHHCRDEQVAWDLHQETFLIVIRKLRRESLEHPERLAAYVHNTAVHLWHASLRKEIGRKELLARYFGADEPACYEDPGESCAREDEALRVRAAIDALPVERDRRILREVYLWDVGKPEVCRRLDLTPVHFDRVIHRARERLGSRLEE